MKLARRGWGWAAACMLLWVAMPAARAGGMRDDIVKVEKSRGLFGVKLTARVYAPLGDGPFPLVVINHGKASGNPAFQKDRGYYFQAREFVKRGYAVLVPTRQGFGSSGGVYRDGGCDIPETGRLQADDIEAAIAYAKTLPFVDAQRIVVIGQSQGGLATMALGERNLPGVLGLINMAGGMRRDSCNGWERSDVDAYAQYGAKSKAPALWMYGDNDSYWGQTLPKSMYDAYVGAGAAAQWVDYGTFGRDSHQTFASRDGMPLWLPVYARFFTSLGLPFDVRGSLRSPGDGPDVENVDAVPLAGSHARALYEAFLGADPRAHRAFAVSASGHCGFATGDDAARQALAYCAEHTRGACVLYAVDERVVYQQADSKE
ncbi:dienelactone hydrolase family protein [Burkholderia alba]|uniref:dienelactone hydrolase family protein n=1 Tax=Burkholderia alba TaxID=2683677 RepID=UPI002B05DC54|nr:CocE/NonD family hydrolase [Burkholderia alba]